MAILFYVIFHQCYIKGAQKLICITGWAVWDKLLLLRGEDLAIDNRTLGEILIDKAENQGVQVSVKNLYYISKMRLIGARIYSF